MLAFAAFDDVACQGKWSATKSDQRNIQIIDQLLNGLPYVRRSRFKIRDFYPLNICRGANGIGNIRPVVGAYLIFNAHRANGRHDIGKKNGSIHAQLFDGEFRHLRTQVRILNNFMNGFVVLDFPVFRLVPACLAHEPNGRMIYRFSPAGS